MGNFVQRFGLIDALNAERAAIDDVKEYIRAFNTPRQRYSAAYNSVHLLLAHIDNPALRIPIDDAVTYRRVTGDLRKPSSGRRST